jgi:DNA polymerase-1
MLADNRFPGQEEDLTLYKRIATMVTNAPLGEFPDAEPTWGRAAELAKAWELNALSGRLAGLAG